MVTALAGLGLPGWLLLLLGLIAAVIVCSVLNFAIEKIAYRPLRNAPRLAPLITAMGMSLLLQTLAMIIWKPNYKSYPDPAAGRSARRLRRGHQQRADPDPGRRR